jgi:hypothetical protein
MGGLQLLSTNKYFISNNLNGQGDNMQEITEILRDYTLSSRKRYTVEDVQPSNRLILFLSQIFSMDEYIAHPKLP